LAGTWIGFDDDGLEFTRLDLRPDFTGYCARVSPSYSSLHEYGVQIYRVTHWTTDGWTFLIDMTAIHAIDTPLSMKGRIEMEALQLEVSAGTNGWTRKLELRFFRDVLVKKHWLKRRFWARLFAGARRVRYAWRPAGPRTGVRESVPAARRPLRMGRRELGSGRDWLGAFKVWA
jgi:hypothetical protein